jgi:hypothetical protein
VEPLVTPQTLDAFAVTAPALPLQQHVHSPVAVAGITASEYVQPLPQQRLIRRPPATVTLR